MSWHEQVKNFFDNTIVFVFIVQKCWEINKIDLLSH